MLLKPKKKSDGTLFSLIEKKIETQEYIFVKHAKERQITRAISDLEVLYILEGKKKYARKHNKTGIIVLRISIKTKKKFESLFLLWKT